MSEEVDFEGLEAVELMHARGLPTAEGEATCLRYLEEGLWKKEPHEWTMLWERLTRRDEATRSSQGWFEAWLDAVAGDTPTQAHQTVLRNGREWGLLRGSIPQEDKLRIADKLVSWLCSKGGAGSSLMVADLVDRVLLENSRGDHHPLPPHQHSVPGRELTDRFAPLVRNLVRVGPGELRQSTRARVVTELVEYLMRLGPPELFVHAFEIMIAAGHEQQLWGVRARDLFLWRLTEAALDAGLPPTRVIDIVSRAPLRRGLRPHVWAPLILEQFPKSRQALCAVLPRGGLPTEQAKVGWSMLFVFGSPECLGGPISMRVTPIAAQRMRDVLSGSSLDIKLGFPWEVSVDGEEVKYSVPTEAVRPALVLWAQFMVQNILDSSGPAHSANGRRSAAEMLWPIVNWSSNYLEFEPHRNFAAVLEDWLDRSGSTDQSVQVALHVLRSNPNPLHATAACVLCLKTDPLATSQLTRGQEHQLGQVQAEIERFISLPWNDPIFGVDLAKLVSTVHEVCFVHDTGAEATTIREGRLELKSSYYLEVLGSQSSDEALALCMLYFVHELLHLPQGIGRYETVQELRETGAELTLLHLDLTADHAAALMVHRATPRWTFTWLQRLVLESLENFPASAFHTHAARHRKAIRVVSTRADLLARERGWDPENRNGYLFAEYAPACEKFFLLNSGPPMRVLGQTTLSKGDSKVLLGAADPYEDAKKYLGKLDAILTRALALVEEIRD